MRRASMLALLLAGCAAEAPPGARIVPGVGVGDVALEMTLADVRAVAGEPQGALVSSRIGFARFGEGLEIVFTSPEADRLTDDALVVGIGVSEGAAVEGDVIPGATRAAVEAALGPSPDVVESFAFYPAGLSVEYDGDRVLRVGVIAPYERRPDVPPMTGASP